MGEGREVDELSAITINETPAYLSAKDGRGIVANMDAPTRSPIPAHPICYVTPPTTNIGFIVFITSITAIGGFLFGYDTAVISGAVGFLETHFHLTSAQTGWAGASAILGCVPGAMFAGFLSDRFGRKTVLILCAVIYIVSGVASAIPHTFSQLLMARFFGGLGIGASSMICLVYIAEISPEKHRGRLCALFQLGIVIGIFVVFFTNLMIQRLGDTTWNTLWGWRWMPSKWHQN